MKGILFSPEMSTAIRQDRKTQTRRLMKPQPDQAGYVAPNWKVPYKKGDILYVREEHYAHGQWVPNGFTAGGRKKWKFVAKPHPGPITRAYSFEHPGCVLPNKARELGWYKRLGRFMPKAYARTFLEVTEVRGEQIQDITLWDAMSEGCEYKTIYSEVEGGLVYVFRDYLAGTKNFVGMGAGKKSFLSLWDSIHTTDFKEISDLNPWVFAYTFKRIEKPSDE